MNEPDQPMIDGGALALCRMFCNAKQVGRGGIGGRCIERCEGAVDLGIWHCSHMNRMREFASAVLTAQPAYPPKGSSY